MVISEPAVLSTPILGLGLKQYPSNMRRMLSILLDSSSVFLECAKIKQVKERL